MSLVSRTFYQITEERLWENPRFRQNMTPQALYDLAHRPIEMLDTSLLNNIYSSSMLNCETWIDAISGLSSIKSLKFIWPDFDTNIGKLCALAHLRCLCLYKKSCSNSVHQFGGKLINLNTLQGLHCLQLHAQQRPVDIEENVKAISEMRQLKKLEMELNDAATRQIVSFASSGQLEELTVLVYSLTDIMTTKFVLDVAKTGAVRLKRFICV